MSKKVIKSFLISVLIILGATGCGLNSEQNQDPSLTSTPNNNQPEFLTLIINNGNQEKEYKLEVQNRNWSSKDSLTAYDTLQEISKRENIKLQTKQYGFGVFIEGIGDKIGDKKSFWLYYINNQLANVSVDNQPVKGGDIIKFIFTNNNSFNQ